MKKPVFLIFAIFEDVEAALRLVASTICCSSIFHLFITLLEKRVFPTVLTALISFNEWPLVH